MPEKRHTAYRHQQDSRRRAYLASRSLREELPRVERLVLQMTFVDPRGAAQHSPQMHTFSRGAKAFFAIPCPCSLCLDGGFDLGPAVKRMLAEGSEESTGRLLCPGWQNPERTEKDRCRIEMRYRLSASYRPPGGVD
ncbi:MAG TPA: hypothetical protein VD791_01150, partial [Burkholderiales bacterium]|nr:hypothetical protein [Burkholderiales bacterium]